MEKQQVNVKAEAGTSLKKKGPRETSFPKDKIKVVLFEGLSAAGVELFKAEGFQVECITGGIKPEHYDKIKDAHAIGIRSASEITAQILELSPRLLTVGCFCIGTNQVDLDACSNKGVAVFNSPFCNTRSVAELIIAQIINLARKLGDKNTQCHSQIWDKSSKNCHEVRGKTLGIVGYGHIGTQLSILAEAIGMRVVYKDISPKMAYSNSKQVSTLAELFSVSHFVTLHVPETPETKNMISKAEFDQMRPGTYFLNASRGSVVVLEDLVAALESNHLAGAYIDVYPTEPKSSLQKDWVCSLQKLPNVMLTPHIGGSTEEAQHAIGIDVASKMIEYINVGNSNGSVNFPGLSLPYYEGAHRVCNVHWNKPGSLRKVNEILSEFNVVGEVLGTQSKIGYLIVEVDREVGAIVKKAIEGLESSIKTRIMF